jgi:predicted metalloprotease with PDZ domain
MMKQVLILIAALALLAPGAVLAGESCSSHQAQQVAEKNYKCDSTPQECLDHMAAYFSERGWVGIELEIDEESGAMAVTRVESHSPAADAGMRTGDVLVALNGVQLNDANKEKVAAAKEKMTIGTVVTYTVERKGSKKDIEVTLGQIPDPVLAKWIGRHMIEGHTDNELALAQN